MSTTIIITALKAFDIVYVMTGGNYDTDVIALQMYKQLFNFRRLRAAPSAVAVVLLLAILPIMIINIRRFREQEAIR